MLTPSAPDEGMQERSAQTAATTPAVLKKSAGKLEILEGDAVWGNADAAVTLLEVGDLEDPFTAKLLPTLEQLKGEYGPEKLRIAWKHKPLVFHKAARGAAIAAQAVFNQAGADAFWKFQEFAFAYATTLNTQNYERWAAIVGVEHDPFSRAVWARETAAKVDADEALTSSLGVTGTPVSLINGIPMSGVRPIEQFRMVIDEQIKLAADLVSAGTSRTNLYATLVEKNIAEGRAPGPFTPPPDLTVYNVPIGKSPVLGKASALVTLVVFSEFDGPLTRRAAPVVQQLVQEYGDKLRIVWKNNPLPFHANAEPAAQLALEAQAKKGNAGFWKAHEALFARQSLDARGLMDIAIAIGLDPKATATAINTHKHRAIIDADKELADDLVANATPTFFVNGRKANAWATPEKLREVIDAQLVAANALIEKGIRPDQVYETIQKDAVPLPVTEDRAVAKPAEDAPSKGPKGAKVTVQMFGDFESPYSKRALLRITELEAQFPGKLRFVWRNLPLSMHKQAEPAAALAMEALRQKGDTAFWSMHERLFQAQEQPGGLNRKVLLQLAGELGLDVDKAARALDTAVHGAAIAADKKAATDAGIFWPIAFLINGHFLTTSDTATRFKRVVARELKSAQ
jgi:protein-disulfide isomerase